MKRTELKRKTPLRPVRRGGRKGQRATREEWDAIRPKVIARDRARCLAPVLDPSVDPAECRGKFGKPAVIARAVGRLIYDVAALTLDHVGDPAKPMLGQKPPDREENLVTECWHHHLNGWATANRGLLWSYLRSIYGGHP